MLLRRIGPKRPSTKERDTKDFELWSGQKIAQLHRLSKERSADFYGVCALTDVAIGIDETLSVKHDYIEYYRSFLPCKVDARLRPRPLADSRLVC